MHELPRDHPLWGREFDWLGIDRHGRVAVFSIAGYGPLPETVNERLADVDAALERADELPAIGSAGNIENSGDGDYSFWYSYSAKGFYATTGVSGAAPIGVSRHPRCRSASTGFRISCKPSPASRCSLWTSRTNPRSLSNAC